MEVQRLKLLAGAAPAPKGKVQPTAPIAASGKELPRQTGIDPVVIQESRAKQAALARQISSFLRSNARELEFQIDPESREPVITVRDADGNVVRRIPGDDALEMLRRVSVDPGTFVDSTV